MANRLEAPETWPTDQSLFQWVEIPKKDMYDGLYPDIWINQMKYEAGKKHFVPPIVAAELTRIMARLEKASRRLMLPTPDKKAMAEADGNSSSGAPRS